MTAAENAQLVIEIEEQLRKSPTAYTRLFDDRAQSLARRLLDSSDHRKARAFAALDSLRNQYEPSAADLYRIGLPIDVALERVQRRAVAFRKLCARAWRWKIDKRDRYVD